MPDFVQVKGHAAHCFVAPRKEQSRLLWLCRQWGQATCRAKAQPELQTGRWREDPACRLCVHKASHCHLSFGFLLTKSLLSKIKSVKLFPHSTEGRCYSLTLMNSNNQKVTEIRGRKANKFLWFSLVPAINDSLKNFIQHSFKPQDSKQTPHPNRRLFSCFQATKHGKQLNALSIAAVHLLRFQSGVSRATQKDSG